MKKTISAALVAMLILLGACSQAPVEQTDTEPQTQEDTNVTETVNTTDTDTNPETNPEADPEVDPGTEEPGPGDAETKTELPTTYTIIRNFYEDHMYAEESCDELAYYSCESFTVEGCSEELKEILEQISAANFEGQNTTYVEYQKEAKEFLADGADAGCFPYQNTLTYSFQRTDSNIISFVEAYYSYAGGIHGYYYYNGVNLDGTTGENLVLTDVITDTDQFGQIVTERLDETLNGRGLLEDNASYVKQCIAGEEECELYWTLNGDGITVYFNPYDVAAYAEGIITVTVDYTEYPDLFTDRAKTVPASYSTELLPNSALFMDVDGDGTKDELWGYTKELSKNDCYVSLRNERSTGMAFPDGAVPGDVHGYVVTLPDGSRYLTVDVPFLYDEENNGETLLLNYQTMELVDTLIGCMEGTVPGNAEDIRIYRPDRENYYLYEITSEGFEPTEY